MTATAKQNDNEMVVQEHCIDLPGESVQCWLGGGTDKLRVTLRKHRDVIFDIKLGNGKSYTVESTESDFYNARDKKIVLAAKRTPVTFHDGERLHLWVSRGFRGALVVKCDGHTVAKVEPNEWDKHRHSDDPKEKPAPIILAIGANTAPHTLPPPPPVKTMAQLHPTKLKEPIPVKAASAPTHDESCPVVCIVDGKVEGMPAHLVEYFAKGGDGSGFAEIDPFHVATRNWMMGQSATALGYITDNWSWLWSSLDGKTSSGFKLVKAKVHYVRGKVRFYFSGFSNGNSVYGRGGFGPAHERVLTIFSGVGKTESVFASTVKGIAGGFKGFVLASLIFGTVTAVAEWYDDVKKDGYDLAAAIIMTILKAIIVSALAVIIVALIVILVMVVFGLSMPVLLVGGLTIAAGVAASYVTEAIDKTAGQAITGEKSNNDGISSVVAPLLRKAGKSLAENWDYLMKKFPIDYREIIF